MGYRSRGVAWWCIVVAAILAGQQTAAAARDYIVLRTGATIYGEIINETPDAVTIRTEAGGIRATVTYRRESIAHYYVAERPDRGSGDIAPTPAPSRPEPEKPEPKKEEGPPIVVIPLHGQVGGLNRGRVSGTFDADMLRECFREAKRIGAVLVVLDIQSPGGYVCEMEAICEVIIAWSGQLRIVAYPREAYSAAAIIALCCRELAVAHDSRIGAAVMARGGSALEAKQASPHLARQRQFMAASRKPYEVLQAMTIQETELWWAPGRGFRTHRPPADEDGWEHVDGPRTVLTMTGEQARRWGVADFMVGAIGPLALQAGIQEPYRVETFTKLMQNQVAQSDRRLEELERNFAAYFQGLGELRSAIEAYISAGRQDDRPTRQRAQADVRRSHAKVMASGHRIRDTERSIMARRLPLHDAVIERLEEDGQLLGMVRRLVNSDRPDGLADAIDRFNAVINAWRELLN
jgi:hypothetical protein